MSNVENMSANHNSFTEEVTDLVDKFHETNPDLFIREINIHKAEPLSKRKILTGITVDIVVQPSTPKH